MSSDVYGLFVCYTNRCFFQPKIHEAVLVITAESAIIKTEQALATSIWEVTLMKIKIAEALKELRHARGNTQEELARHLGISVQAVSKWERGEGMPDITLLPYIASYYDTTVDHLLGCGDVRRHEEIEAFEAQENVFINQGKRREGLSLCREMQKKYPNDETILRWLMHDLYAVDRKEHSEEIIATAERLLRSDNQEYRYEAIQTLALTYSALGEDEKAYEYAVSVPCNRDLLVHVLKGEKLAEHCRWFFWRVCDRMYLTHQYLTRCPEAGYSAQERHAIRKAIYDMFHIVFSDGDFGFAEDRLSMLCRDMALASAEAGEVDRAFEELAEMCEHLTRMDQFVSIDHTSPLVKGLHYEASLIGRSSEVTYAKAVLRQLEQNPRFACLQGDPRLDVICEKLRGMA